LIEMAEAGHGVAYPVRPAPSLVGPRPSPVAVAVKVHAHVNAHAHVDLDDARHGS